MLRQWLVLLTFWLAGCSCAAVNNTPLPALAPADPASMTSRSPWLEAGQVTLAQGVYRAPAAPGSAAELMIRLTDRPAFGTLAGKTMGAVILVTQTGGSGTLYDLALLAPERNGWINRDLVLLGDRIDIDELVLRDNQLVVEMTTHGPQDPMCCPTLQVERRFAVQENRLADNATMGLKP
jgi:hypothetical protein